MRKKVTEKERKQKQIEKIREIYLRIKNDPDAMRQARKISRSA